MTIRSAVIACVTLVVTACGGGGGDSPGPPVGTPPVVAPPVATAVITSQPANQTAAVGQTAAFQVVATGTNLTYQWQRDGVDIVGATADTYTPTVTASDNGTSYRVRVSSGSTSIFSNAATLTLTASVSPHAARISAGLSYSLAVRVDGSVLAWGAGMSGGTGTQIVGAAASVVNGMSGAAVVIADSDSVTSNSLAIRTDGQVYSWGFSNENAALRDAPTAWPALSPAVSISRCTTYLLGAPYFILRRDGTVWFAGTQQVVGLSSVVAMSARGDLNSVGGGCIPLAVKSDGTVWAITLTGSNIQIAQMAGLPAITEVSCVGGVEHTCLALSVDGHVWAWGDNRYGSLGDGTRISRTIPIQIAGLTNIQHIDAGVGGSAALAIDKRLYTWGLGASRSGDLLLPGLTGGWSDVEAVSVGVGHWLVLRTDGSVWAWGDNSRGQLGDGTSGNRRTTPVQVIGINLN